MTGTVYILTNDAMPGQLKIGMTTRDPHERARELSRGTGVALPFVVVYSAKVPDALAAEKLIHQRLHRFRTNRRREFFELPLKDAVKELNKIVETVRQGLLSRRMMSVFGETKTLMVTVMFLLIASSLFCFGCPVAVPQAQHQWVYIGTGSPEGIFRCELDPETGKLTQPEVAAKLNGPSFLELSPDGKTLYSVGSVPKMKVGSVFSFAIDPSTGALKQTGMAPSGGNGPCHVSVDDAGKFLIVSNYGGGSCATIMLGDDGRIVKQADEVQHEGSSVNKQRQAGPHAHCGFFSNDGKRAYVCDLGLDKLLIYNVDRTTGKLTANDPPFIKLPDGTGPRHMHIINEGKTILVNGELNNTINVIEIDPTTGGGTVKQSVPTLPLGFAGQNTTSEIRLHPNGKFIYVANRGQNSIAGYTWNDNKLSLIGFADDGINIPRNFRIDDTGKWLLVANQDGNNVNVFAIDAETGKLTATGQKIDVPRPMCVKFLPKE